MNFSVRRVAAGAAALAIGATVMGCAAKTEPGNVTKQQHKVTAQMGWQAGGQYVHYAVAKAKGYYEEEGLDVTLAEGSGNLGAVTVAGAQTNVIAVNVDYAIVPVARSKGAQVKGVAVTNPVSQLGLCLRKDANVKTPKDLAGKKLGLPAGAFSAQMLPALLAANGVDASKVQIVNTSVENMTVGYANDTIQGVACVRNDNYQVYVVKGPPSDGMFFADFGVPVLGVGMVANEKLITEKPDVVRGFVKATMRGADFMAANPEEATDLLIKQFPNSGIQRDIALVQVKDTGKLYKDGLTANGAGWSDPKTWGEALSVLVKYTGLDAKLAEKPEDLFTNEFVVKK